MNNYQIKFTSSQEKEIYNTLEEEAKKKGLTTRNFILSILKEQLEKQLDRQFANYENIILDLQSLRKRIQRLEKQRSERDPKRVIKKTVIPNEEENVAFYETLDKILKSKKITAKELSGRVKIPYNSFRPYRSGKRFSPQQVKKIKKAIENL